MASRPDPARILFVCLGNICRSPTAEGVFRALVAREGLTERVVVDSAGTGDWHIGKPPDARAVAHAGRRGIDLTTLRARQIAPDDFDRFDLVLAMDRANHEDLVRLAPPARRDRVRLFLSFAEGARVDEVPDPYLGGADGFEHVLDLVEDACAGLLRAVQRREW